MKFRATSKDELEKMETILDNFLKENPVINKDSIDYCEMADVFCHGQKLNIYMLQNRDVNINNNIEILDVLGDIAIFEYSEATIIMPKSNLIIRNIDAPKEDKNVSPI